MTFKIQAPYPPIQVTTFLPDPIVGDSVAVSGSVIIKRKMNGSKKVYVQGKNTRRKYIWQFNITRHKALELAELINAYFARDILITFDNDTFIGNFTVNPFEFETTSRMANFPGEELVTISLEFEADNGA